MYNFTKYWFSDSDICKNIKKYLKDGTNIKILEIGSYEGMSTCFFLDNFLSHDEAFIDCVDPFFLEDETTPVDNNTYDLFIDNVSKSKNHSKYKLYKKLSSEFFKDDCGDKIYDFIYIDGSHKPEDIKEDMENSFRHLREKGIMWMDDYMGGKDDKIKKVMDEFVTSYRYRSFVLFKGYQLAIFKLF